MTYSFVLQTADYKNAAFPTNRTPIKQFYYINGSPPEFGCHVHRDGSVPAQLCANILFYEEQLELYPNASGVWGFASTKSEVYGFENFIAHPKRPRVRISFFHTYRSGRLFIIGFNCEVDSGFAYPSNGFERLSGGRRFSQRPSAGNLDVDVELHFGAAAVHQQEVCAEKCVNSFGSGREPPGLVLSG